MIRVFLGSLVVFTTLSTSASADIKLDLRVGPPQPMIEPAALSGHTIFLNRCAGPDGIPNNADGGCPVNPGNDDATANPPTSGVPSSPSVLSEYTDFAAGEWEATVQCVKEVYSPFDVKIVDTKPPAGTQYSMIMVGGSGAEVGSPGSGGVAIVSGNCAPIVKGVSYAFTDQIDIFAQEIGGSRPLGLCWIIAQETAHSFGLDHEFAYLDDMRSACNDPMTYRDDCGGQKFYRNKFASCGEFEQQGPRQCRCGSNQNSHLMLSNIFGPGTSLIGAPEVAVTTPAVSSTAANSLPANIIASAGSKRGVNRVELYLNGFKWVEVNGAPFGRQGQINPSAYGLLPPANLPDSIYDIEVRAFDDLEIVGISPIVTVTKGAAGGCVSADACALGQKCEAGKCFWDPPSGVVGDSCDFPEFCLSGKCEGTADEKICTQNCIPGVADSCPMGLTCLENGNNDICYLPSEEGGGCCSTSNGTTPWAPFGFAGVVLGFVLVRRRRR